MKPDEFIALCYSDHRAAVDVFFRTFLRDYTRISTYEKSLVASRMREILQEMEAVLPVSVVSILPALIDAGHEMHCDLCVHTSPRAQKQRREQNDDFSAAAWAVRLDGFARAHWPQAQTNRRTPNTETSPDADA